MVVFVLIFPYRVLAQEHSNTTAYSIPAPVYIAKMDTIISLKLNVNSEYERFTVSVNNDYYDIRPNISISSKISINYRFISFGIGFTPKFIPGNNDNDLKGETKAFSIGANISTNHILQELQAYMSKGFIYITRETIIRIGRKGLIPILSFLIWMLWH